VGRKQERNEIGSRGVEAPHSPALRSGGSGIVGHRQSDVKRQNSWSFVSNHVKSDFHGHPHLQLVVLI
jgi:hypothetical protein